MRKFTVAQRAGIVEARNKGKTVEQICRDYQI